MRWEEKEDGKSKQKERCAIGKRKALPFKSVWGEVREGKSE